MSELYTKYATEQYVDNNLNIGLATKADAEHNHDSSYDVKGAANTALNSAKEYADTIINGLATEEYVDNAVANNGSVQPDWNQTDETAADYIKNRTHYENIGITRGEELTSQTNISFSNDGDYYELEEYLSISTPSVEVVWDGVSYICDVEVTSSSKFSFGDIDLVQYPFYYINENAFNAKVYGKDGYHTMTIYECNVASEIKQLDEKYIPDTIARISQIEELNTVIATDENSDGNIVLRPYIPEEDFIQVDKTLTIEGAAADAKAVGDRLQNLNVDMATIEVSDPNDDGNVVLTQLGGEFIDDYLTAEEANTMFAPSGYVANVIDIASESELDTALTNIITNMPDLTERHVVFQDNAGLFNGGFTLARIFTRVGTYATATFETYGYYGYTKWVKNCYNGSWYPLEWETPPMTLEVEYRTTERHNGKAVYVKYYNAGVLKNNTLYSLPSGVTDIVRMQAYTNRGHLLPVGQFIKDDTSSGYFAYAVTNVGANGVYGFTDTRTDGFGNGSYNMYIKLWYTKD